jgi:hypothetical protein
LSQQHLPKIPAIFVIKKQGRSQPTPIAPPQPLKAMYQVEVSLSSGQSGHVYVVADSDEQAIRL